VEFAWKIEEYQKNNPPRIEMKGISRHSTAGGGYFAHLLEKNQTKVLRKTRK